MKIHRVVVLLPGPVMHAVERLNARGLHGVRVEETIERLVCEALLTRHMTVRKIDVDDNAAAAAEEADGHTHDA